MLTLEEIRRDLKEIQYYYSKQKVFDNASKTFGANAVLDKVQKYNGVIKDAPATLYALYISLYINNNTQEALSFDWDCSKDNIRILNRKLCEFFQSVFG